MSQLAPFRQGEAGQSSMYTGCLCLMSNTLYISKLFGGRILCSLLSRGLLVACASPCDQAYKCLVVACVCVR